MSTKNMGVLLSPEQKEAVEYMEKSPEPVFITGGAGTGKSTVVVEYISVLAKAGAGNRNIVVTGTTNFAADNLSRQFQDQLGSNVTVTAHTVHSAFNMLPIVDFVTSKGHEIMKYELPDEVPKKIRGSIFIVDECSMLDRKFVKFILKNEAQFDRVIFIGDECQLPPVKGKPFKFAKNLKTFELTVIHRAGENKDLAEYYQTSREKVKAKEKVQPYKNAIIFIDTAVAISKAKSMGASFCVLSFANKTVSKNLKILGETELMEGQTIRLLGNYTAKSIEKHGEYKGSKFFMKLSNKSTVQVVKIFETQKAMWFHQNEKGYEYWLPSESSEFPEYFDKYGTWVLVKGARGKLCYMSILYDRTAKSHSQSIADMPNGLARDLMDKIIDTMDKMSHQSLQNALIKYKRDFVRDYKNSDDKEKKSKAKHMKYWKIEKSLYSMDTLYALRELRPDVWEKEGIAKDFNAVQREHFRFKDMIPVTSATCSTVHSAQGITVDTVVVNWNELSRRGDQRLIYTAVSRASKNIILIKG